MSCDCCLVPNGHNIILEIVTIVFAAIFLIMEMFFGSGSTFNISCNVALIICCGFGIAALKRQENYRLGWVAVVFAAIVFIPFVVLMIIFFIGLPVVVAAINAHLNEEASREEQQQQAAVKGIVIFSLILIFAYIAFGVGTSLALAIKHFKICRKMRRNDTSNNVVVGTTTTIQYVPPGQPQPTPYYSGMSPQQQANPPPTYYEKSKSDMV